jgi:hypothetical protein
MVSNSSTAGPAGEAVSDLAEQLAAEDGQA